MIQDLQRQLGIDGTFFTQFLIFLLIFTWLQYVFFRPFLQLIQKREGLSGGLSEEASKLEEAAARDEQQYAEGISAARRRAAQDREQLLAEARKSANESVAAARGQSKTRLEQARDSALRSADAELGALRGQVGPVAALLVEKLTKTKVGL